MPAVELLDQTLPELDALANRGILTRKEVATQQHIRQRQIDSTRKIMLKLRVFLLLMCSPSPQMAQVSYLFASQFMMDLPQDKLSQVPGIGLICLYLVTPNLYLVTLAPGIGVRSKESDTQPRELVLVLRDVYRTVVELVGPDNPSSGPAREYLAWLGQDFFSGVDESE